MGIPEGCTVSLRASDWFRRFCLVWNLAIALANERSLISLGFILADGYPGAHVALEATARNARSPGQAEQQAPDAGVESCTCPITSARMSHQCRATCA
jgi:hypothetical protein